MGRLPLILGLAAALTPAWAHASAADLFYERTLMSAADARCDLFAPQVSSALAAAGAQARGAALRSGVDTATLAGVEQRARAKAAATACRSPDLATAAGRVRSAFDGYAKMSRISYPGDIAGWQADRSSSKPRWRLAQSTRFGFDRLQFGLAGTPGRDQLIALAAFADGQTPYAARIVMRDTARTGRAYLARYDGKKRPPLPGRLPPGSASRAVMAEARAPADEALTPAGFERPLAFRFPATAVASLAALDPREAVAVEFLFSRRGRPDEVRRAYIEVGDFAAGRAFLQVAAR